MPIEDVSFLKQNSVHDANIIKVDSSLRNKKFYPLVSEFPVIFEDPIGYVYGLDLLDISMPSSMYNIEDINNGIKFHKIWFNFNFFGNVVSQQDFYDTYFKELYTIPILIKFFENNNISNKIVFVDFQNKSATENILESVDEQNLLATRYHFHNFKIRQVYKITQTGSFFFRLGDSIFAIDKSDVNEKERLVSALQENTFKVTTIEKNATFFYFNDFMKIPVHIHNDITIIESDNVCVHKDMLQNTYTIVFYKHSFFTDIEFINFTRNQKIEWCPLILLNGINKIEVGNYNIFEFQSELVQSIADTENIVLKNKFYDFPFNNLESKLNFQKVNKNGDLTKTGHLEFVTKAANVIFIIDLKNSSLSKVMGFSSLGTKADQTLFERLVHPRNHLLVSSIWNQKKQSNIITPPGVIYLLGHRYVILRCPEIETAMGSQIGTLAPGIGLIKLALNQETVQQRLDFVNYKRKPFHPIEKLTKLTFRFELPSGELYDFKGIDVFMIVQVNSYAPVMKKEFDYKHSQLNPNYNPDFVQYNITEQERYNNQKKLNDGRYEFSNQAENAIKKLVQDQNNYYGDSTDNESNNESESNSINDELLSTDLNRFKNTVDN